jgi:type I restriction enzyme S subunit
MSSESAMPCLGDFVSLQRGTTYKSDLLGMPGPVLLGLASIEPNGGFRTNALKTYGGESPEKLILRPGDLYVSLKDVTQSADLLGAIARVPLQIHEGRVTQDTVKLVFSGSAMSKNYIYWLLRTPLYREYCRARAMGTTNLSLSRDDFLAFPVTPPTTSQLSFVELLEALEEKIALLRETNVTLEAIAKALFKSWFVDFDPVRAKAEGREPEGMDEEVARLFPAGFEKTKLGFVPMGWKASTLVEHIQAERGLSYKGAGLCSAEEGRPMHNLNSVYEGGGYKYPGIKFYKGEFKDRHVVRAGDIIVANTEQGHEHRLIGFPAIVPAAYDKGIFSHHLYRLTIKAESPLTRQVLYYLLMSPNVRDQVVGCTNGSTVNMLKIQGMEIPRFVCPPASVAKVFDDLTLPLRKQVELNVARAQTLTAVRDTLLPHLISDRIGLADAEASTRKAA